MKFEAFENCLRLLNPSINDYGSFMDIFIDNHSKLKPEFTIPFASELNLNILERSTDIGKEDLIIYYMSRFSERIPYNMYSDEIKKIIKEYPSPVPEYFDDTMTEHLGMLDLYSVNRYRYIDSLMMAVQKTCYFFNIPFIKICKHVFFPYKQYDLWFSVELLKLKPSTKKSDNDSFVNPFFTETQSSIDFENFARVFKELENMFWKGMPMEKVLNHFLVFIRKKNSIGEHYLTPAQLISFLKRGFLNDQTEPKQKINCSSGEKGFVIKRFYDFYDIAVGQYQYPRKTAKFITLLANCFDNWNEKTILEFFKPNKIKEKW